jgi:hypothetical protein
VHRPDAPDPDRGEAVNAREVRVVEVMIAGFLLLAIGVLTAGLR